MYLLRATVFRMVITACHEGALCHQTKTATLLLDPLVLDSLKSEIKVFLFVIETRIHCVLRRPGWPPLRTMEGHYDIERRQLKEDKDVDARLTTYLQLYPILCTTILSYIPHCWANQDTHPILGVRTYLGGGIVQYGLLRTDYCIVSTDEDIVICMTFKWTSFCMLIINFIMSASYWSELLLIHHLDIFNQNWSNKKIVHSVFPNYGRFSMRHIIDYN